MSGGENAFWMICKTYRPHIFMVFVQGVATLLYFLIEASFNKGMNPHVFVTYRHALGGIVVLPFAYVLERYFLYTLRSFSYAKGHRQLMSSSENIHTFL